MADGNDEVDCSSVVKELYTFLDGELTETRRVLITRHLHRCVDCHEVVDFHAELKMVISQKCRDRVPEHLRERILRAIGATADGFGGGIAGLQGPL
jgi:mycothiol system anti-sigma-R factor